MGQIDVLHTMLEMTFNLPEMQRTAKRMTKLVFMLECFWGWLMLKSKYTRTGINSSSSNSEGWQLLKIETNRSTFCQAHIIYLQKKSGPSRKSLFREETTLKLINIALLLLHNIYYVQSGCLKFNVNSTVIFLC